VSATPSELRATLFRQGGTSGPLIHAAITGDQWWEPENGHHIHQLTSILAAEIRRKWQFWQAGDSTE
jgi:hypothetical protein